MQRLKRIRSWSTVLLVLSLALGSVVFAQASAPAEPRQGGTLVIAAGFEPDVLDAQKVTRAIVMEYTSLSVEGLFHIDRDGIAQPALVDSYSVSSNELEYSFTLRSGLKFHDDTPLDTDAVLASMERWFNWGSGRTVAGVLDELVVVDDLTLVVRLTEPYPLLIPSMAVPAGTGLYIFPRHLMEEAGTDNLPRLIGTGPYVQTEWIRGTAYRVDRWEEYQARSEPTSGYAGDQTPYLDTIIYRIVPDAAVRLAGMEAGEFDVAREMPSDFFDLVVANPMLRAQRYDSGPIFLQIDRAHGLTEAGWTGQQRFREAVSYAINVQEVSASIGNPEFYSADDCNLPVPPAWRTDICQERYQAFDPERAREILAEIGYDGTTLTYVVDPSREMFFNPALTIAQQLRDVGINVELLTVDAATVLDMRERPRTWDFIQGAHSDKADPTLWSPAIPDHFGWFGSYPDDLLEVYTAVQNETDVATRIALWERFTDIWYDFIPMVKIADQLVMNVENVRFSGVEMPGTGIYMNYGVGWK